MKNYIIKICDQLKTLALLFQPYPTYRLTRFGAHLGAHMAEYVIAMIISRERRFPDMSKDQENKEW